MNSQLSSLGYAHDATSGVWAKPGYGGIAYSDGDEVEQRIGKAVAGASDLGTLSPELARHCQDWPSLYHLSPHRANIMRAFQPMLDGATVLEVGAGCGAITRYLGEAGAQVLALEGSLRRAAIARSRTRDLGHVDVVAESFSDFACEQRFDVVTLIGVLEYASLFMPGDAPAQAMLSRVRSFLKPGGRVIVAIENQFGLKYFAGAPEDHVGRPMYGIEDRYHGRQPRTYGKVALTEILQTSGFAQVEFLAPFPDYKFPTSVVTEVGFEARDFDASAFAWQGVRRDPQLPALVNFSMELAWPAIVDNDLGLHLANSFLVVATPGIDPQSRQRVLAYHFSTSRIPAYCKEVQIVRDASQAIKVECRLLHPGARRPDNGDLLFEPAAESDYVAGGVALSREFIQLVAADGWSVDDVAGFFRRYLDIIYRLDATERRDAVSPASISGKFLDALPTNILRGTDGAWHVIDTEWKAAGDVGADRLVFRAMLWMTTMISRWGQCDQPQALTHLELTRDVLGLLGMDASIGNLAQLIAAESRLQEAIAGQAIPDYLDTWSKTSLATSTPSSALEAKTHEIATLLQELAAVRTALSAAQQYLGAEHDRGQLLDADRARAVAGLDAVCAWLTQRGHPVSTEVGEPTSFVHVLEQAFPAAVPEPRVDDSNYADRLAMVQRAQLLQNTVNAMKSSMSWRVTAPVRWALKPHLALGDQLRRAAKILELGGGVAGTAALAVKVLREEGFKGVRWRLTNAGALSLGDGVAPPAAPVHPPPAHPRMDVGAIPSVSFDSTHEGFQPKQANRPICPSVRVIAFYLPQFHPFPENDAWWGKGFTEWTNVGKALPNYIGHHQPHCPIHLGYYDLRVPEVMEEQAALAREYGIYGFNFYFYWFDGKILMHRPFEMLLQNRKIDINFHFTWANENWSRRWDGQENDVLIAQRHSDEDSLAFIRYMLPFFRDERYIKVDGKPVLAIYRASIIPDIKKTAELWRSELTANGFPGIYLIAAQTFGIRSPDEFEFDAAMEFPPHTSKSDAVHDTVELTNPDFRGNIFSYPQVVANAVRDEDPPYTLFRSVMLSWDNTARKQHASHIFHGFSLLRYKQWLSCLMVREAALDRRSGDEKFVYINAWNEWAEGTHLEPDQKYGYGYLQTTYDVLKNFDVGTLEPRLLRRRPEPSSRIAVVVHLHYLEIWPDIVGYLSQDFSFSFDLYVTTTTLEGARRVLQDFPGAYVEVVENRGRDVLPFTRILGVILEQSYRAVCKIHSKKSAYRSDGEKLRQGLLDGVLGTPARADHIVQSFESDESLGLVAPADFLLAHTDHNMTFDHAGVRGIAKELGIEFSYDVFPAGSMFWFRPQALQRLAGLRPSLFELESGLADGTVAHAVERLFAIVAKHAGYKVQHCT